MIFILLSANLGAQLEDFYRKFTSAGININGPGSLSDQTGGYYTLGGAVVRNPVVNAQIASIQMPNIKADCGGIDIYAGGFSFINSDQLVNTMKSIGSSAISYAFMLALETVSPQITNVITKLQGWAQEVNSLNINSCETAATLTSAVLPRGQMSSRQACKIMGSSTGVFADFAKARQGCSDDGEVTRQLDNADARYPDILKEKFNVAWLVIQKNQMWANDRQLAEVMMSMTGTIVSNGSHGFKVFKSKVFDDNFFKYFLEGGQMSVYKCQEYGKCLIITEGTQHLNADRAFYGKVRNLLQSIEQKIYTDAILTQEEQSLINETSIPIYKIISVMSAYHQGRSPIDLMSYAQLIAQDMAISYIKNVISIARYAAAQLLQAQMNADPLQSFIKNLNDVEQKLRHREQDIKNKIDQVYLLIKKTKLLEQELYAKMRAIVKE